MQTDETTDRADPHRSGPVGIPSGYQPALDGVRAVAVGMVMCFHLGMSGGLSIVAGGWLGVDVFFVLSGYLITSLLLAEHRRHGGIGLRRFYARRFLRLAPLSVGLVLVLWLVTAVGGEDAVGLQLPFTGGIAVLFYYSNWWAIARPDGLGSLAHAWSLSIEEQFYFVWPWVVVGVIAVARRAARTVLLVVTLAAVVTIGLVRRHYWTTTVVPQAAGYVKVDAWLEFFRNSFLRGDGLLYGCLLALLLHGVKVTPLLRRLVAAAALPAIVVAVLIVAHTHFGVWKPWVPFIPAWGLSVFDVSVTVVVAWLVLAPGSPLARLLGLAPLTWVGRRAYGIYLLHPLVLDVLATTTSLHRWPMELTGVATTLVLAGLSFHYFETPFLRLKERFSSNRPDPDVAPVAGA